MIIKYIFIDLFLMVILLPTHLVNRLISNLFNKIIDLKMKIETFAHRRGKNIILVAKFFAKQPAHLKKVIVVIVIKDIGIN